MEGLRDKGVYPVRVWDRNSNTGELLELYHQLRKSYELPHNQKSGVTEKEFEEKRGFLLWGVQTNRVTFTLFNTGDLDAKFCGDNLDEVETDN